MLYKRKESMSEYLIIGPIGPDLIAASISGTGNSKNSGGHSVFIGQVRDDVIEGRRVAAIEYSAYEPMVKQEAQKIREEILSEFTDVASVDIFHSSGIVKAGEISLFVMVSAGHRHQAIEACRVTVERIKERLPVWKKEIFEDDTHRWKGNG
jgi:molybdopterin synthase catalytic subunit